MLDHYPVTYCGSKVGTLIFSVSGLYYQYNGTFQFDTDSIYRVYAISPHAKLNLGVCIPSEGKWSIRGTIATNKLDIDNIRFEIHSPGDDDRFIPFMENKPFADLENLPNYRFCRRGAQVGLTFTEENTVSAG